jgi:hypothetical protein
MRFFNWLIVAPFNILVSAGASAETPGVRCVLVVPPETKPWSDAQGRLTLVLKDVQWWYSCQMEGHGYGAKTFSLETDASGKVVVHIARLADRAPRDPNALRQACVAAGERILGDPRQRKGTVMAIVYNGYIWTDEKQFRVEPHGRAVAGRWAFFTAWHFFNVAPAAWRIEESPDRYANLEGVLDPIHHKVLKATGGIATVGRITSSGHGGFAHELGHAFGLHHRVAGQARVKGDLMTTDLWMMRGNFLGEILNDWTCLHPLDAAILDKNPLFRIRMVGPPSTGVPREVGMRGVQKSNLPRRGK